ncbi:2-oxo acid dehydrogenase subunit E2 [Rhabdochlamydiaceae symbiont of Dictyostelium giganteum]|uniref:2-oxo acid dehydrogenase subunit E2 n=1 Tax=Rhabdochlamydiaceae symbiont of Dictyostelium giganteum TaxID=3342349 RepID=UPI003850B4BF
MKIDILIPAMGESISDVTISRILKPSKSFVTKEEEILEIETDKVNQVIYAQDTGVLELLVSEGDSVTVHQQIGSIDLSAKTSNELAPLQEPLSSSSIVESKGVQESSFISPSVQDIQAPQEEKSLTLSLSLEEPSQKNSSSSKRKKMSTLRKTVARKLVEAKNVTAMLTTFNEVDMSEVLAIRGKEKGHFQEHYGVKLGLMSFFIKAAALALQKFPEVNAYIDGDDTVYHDRYDISVAVSTDKGLMTPVIRGCLKSSFKEIEEKVELFAKRAREGLVTLADLQGGCFTITNGGVFGSLFSTPILNFPQCAILGMHTIIPRAVVRDDQIVIRPIMYLALSYDHRQIDGKEAVEFLAYIKELIENPLHLLF